MKATISAVTVKMANGTTRYKFTVSDVPGITEQSKSLNSFASRQAAIDAGKKEFNVK